ncbi:MAG: hypothetical protein WC809_02640 [Sinimarinibacterium sp.]|jgi:hypothetical protein
MEGIILQFADFVTKTTGAPVTVPAPLHPTLPQYLEALYRPYAVAVGGQALCAIETMAPELPPPGRLVKQLRRLSEQLQRDPDTCCLVTDHLDAYSRRRLVELKQPFCLPGQQLYWPALGAIQTRIRDQRRPAPPGEHLSPAAQQALLAILLRRIALPSAITALAKPLHLSPITASRVAAELTGSGLLQVEDKGRHRWLQSKQTLAAVWAQAQPRLRDPIMRIVRVRVAHRPPQARLLAGEAALAEQTMLAPPPLPTYAMAHLDWRAAGRDVEVIEHDDDGLCRIELWRYPPERLSESPYVDPLSLVLSLRKLEDERVMQATRALMETLPWLAA